MDVTQLPDIIPQLQALRLRVTTLEDLNDLVKERIFSYIDPSERQKLRRVCKSWFQLINRAFGIKAYIDNTNTELVHSSPWIEEAELVSLTRPIRTDRISFAERIKKIQFKRMIVHYNLFPILQKCKHLQSLTFFEPEVDLSETTMKFLMPNDIVLDELQSLTLECWTFSESLSTIIKLLTTMNFGNLEEINFRSVHPPMLPLALIFSRVFDENNEGINPLIKLVRRNLTTLTKFTVGTMIAQNTFKFILHTVELGGIAQLEELYLQNLYSTWTPMLHHQVNLKILIIKNCTDQQWTVLRTCIVRNILIRRIVIEGRTFGAPWDCNVFEGLEHLQQLTINISLSAKLHLGLLPSIFLTKLEIDGPLAKLELFNIMEIRSLKQLQFNSLGINTFLLNNPAILPEEVVQGRDNSTKINLRMFVKFVRILTRLEIFSFKDCSHNGLDWLKINEWTNKTSAEYYQWITVDNHYYDLNGRRFQHGLTLKIDPDFDHGLIDLPPIETSLLIYENGRGFFGVLRNLFGFA